VDTVKGELKWRWRRSGAHNGLEVRWGVWQSNFGLGSKGIGVFNPLSTMLISQPLQLCRVLFQEVSGSQAIQEGFSPLPASAVLLGLEPLNDGVGLVKSGIA